MASSSWAPRVASVSKQTVCLRRNILTSIVCRQESFDSAPESRAQRSGTIADTPLRRGSGHLEALPVLPAGSGGQRNTSASACDGVLKLEGLSRAFVELLGDGVEVGLGQGAEVEASGQVLAQQAVGVLVAAALPG